MFLVAIFTWDADFFFFCIEQFSSMKWKPNIQLNAFYDVHSNSNFQFYGKENGRFWIFFSIENFKLSVTQNLLDKNHDFFKIEMAIYFFYCFTLLFAQYRFTEPHSPMTNGPNSVWFKFFSTFSILPSKRWELISISIAFNLKFVQKFIWSFINVWIIVP